MTNKIYSLIDGQDVKGSGEDYKINSPANNQEYQFCSPNKDEINIAFENCRKSQKDWRNIDFEKRCEILRKYAELVKENQSELATIIAEETGKPFWETKTEAGAVAAKIEISINSFMTRTNSTSDEKPDGTTHLLTHRPIGVFTVIGPFNFPAHLPNGHIVPSLLAGNGVVFKPSDFTPRSGIFIVKLMHQAGVPVSLVQVVLGNYKLGEMITEPDLIDGLLFTGSPKVGLLLHKKFAGYPNKIVALEMGGNNPLIWWDNNDYQAGALTVVQSSFLSSGQRCTCSRRLILPNNENGRKYLAALVELTKTIIVDQPFAEQNPFMGPVINENTAKNLVSKAQEIMKNGGKEHCKLENIPSLGPSYVTPGIYEITDHNSLVDEEDFGPLLKVFFVDDFEQAIELSNRTSFGLSAGLISDDESKWKKFYNEIKAGIVNWNRQTTGASSASPFGGPGLSGNFRPSAFYAADYCAYPMASVAANNCPAVPEKVVGLK